MVHSEVVGQCHMIELHKSSGEVINRRYMGSVPLLVGATMGVLRVGLCVACMCVCSVSFYL